MELYPINWLHVLWGAAGGVLLSLALMNLVLATRGRDTASRAHLLLSLLAAAAAGIVGFELLVGSSRTPEQSGALLRGVHVPITLLVVSIPWFVLMMFRAGRPWLALVANAVWMVPATVNFTLPYSRLYREITQIERVSWFGATEFTWVSGPTHPWAWPGYLGVLLTLVFVIDAALILWRRDERSRAITVGAFLGASIAIGLFHSMLIDVGVLRSPYMIGLGFLVIMLAMASELVRDAARTPDLEHRVEVQREEVAQLSRNSMLGEISGGLAHELSQPLNAILNNAQSALSFLERDHPDLEEVRDALSEIAEQDRHACEVIRGFAQLVKQGERDIEPVSINRVVEEVLELARRDLERSGIDVRSDLDPANPRIRGDRVLLSVIVFNLVRNAAEAVTEHDCEDCAIRVTTRARNGRVEVEVTDTGPGIAEDHRDQVFDAFFTTRRSGTGLGLAVSRTLAEMHGGEIRPSPGPGGRGTSMTISLPNTRRTAV